MKYLATLGIALLVIAAASVGPWAPSPFTSQTGTNTTAAAWRVAIGVTSGSSMTNAALVGGTVVNQTNTSLTAARVMVTDANKVPTNSAITSTTLGYLDATSSIQTQLDAKPTSSLTNLALLNTANTYTAGQTVTAGKVSSTDGFNASGNLAFYIGGSTLVGYFQAAGSHFNASGDGYFDGSSLRLGANSGALVSMAKSGNNILLSPASSGYVGMTNLAATNLTTSLGTYTATTAPTPAAGSAYVYAKTSGTTELWVMDSAGNETQISPHARATSPAPASVDAGDKTPIVIHHRNLFTGEQEWLHLSAMARKLEQLTGEKFVFRQAMDPADVKDWAALKESARARIEAEHAAALAAWQSNTNANKGPRPTKRELVNEPRPSFLK